MNTKSLIVNPNNAIVYDSKRDNADVVKKFIF